MLLRSFALCYGLCKMSWGPKMAHALAGEASHSRHGGDVLDIYVVGLPPARWQTPTVFFFSTAVAIYCLAAAVHSFPRMLFG